MASSRALALFLLCALLPAPPVSATLLFGGGKSAKKAGVDAEWRPATATWYGEAEGDGSDGEHSQLCSSTPYHAGLIILAAFTGLRDSGLGVVCIPYTSKILQGVLYKDTAILNSFAEFDY